MLPNTNAFFQVCMFTSRDDTADKPQRSLETHSVFCCCMPWAGTLQIETGERRRGALRSGSENRKGCDFGYAPAVDSCEGVAGVDACTVAALDTITAFAVPNLGGHLATPSIFSGLAVLASRLAYRPISLVQVGNELLKPTLFDRRLWTCHIGYALAANSCERVAGVDACTVSGPGCDHRFRSSKPRRTSRNAVDFFGSGGSASCLAHRSLRLTSSRLRIWCRSFLPSTKVILTEAGEMSTPKVCAQPYILAPA